MISLKNKIYILLLFLTYVFPLGGIGIGGLANNISFEGNENDGNFNLSSQNNGLENGFNLFIYFDALPLDLAIEYSKEIKVQELTSMITFNGDEIENPLFTARTSDYLTLRKDIKSLSIPILAKVAFSLGGGLNSHKSVIPSIALLKDIYNVEDINDLYNQASQDWEKDAVAEKIEDYAQNSSGLHIQFGFQGKILMFNIFANAKYTFITDTNNSIDSFPGYSIGFAYGI